MRHGLFNKKVIAVLIVTLLLITTPGVAFAADCSWYDIPCHFKTLVSWGAAGLLMLFGFILYLAGLVFDLSIKYSVADFGSLVDKLQVVSTGWRLLRDLVNVLFIFLILYIAVSIILRLEIGGGGAKRLLTRLIIIALLINFSAFFTRVVIDFSNVVAYQFYQAMSSEQGSKSLSAVIVGGTGLQKFFDQPTWETFKSAADEITGGGWVSLITRTFLNIILILISAFVLLTAAILFTVRTLTLIILLVLSPLAFMAFAFPAFSDQWKKWWDRLLGESFFAPVCLLFIYIVYSILIKGTLRISSPSTEGTGFIINLYNFLIIIGLMLGALIAGKKLSGTAAGGAMKLAGLATGGLTAGGVGLARKGGGLARAIATKEGREGLGGAWQEFKKRGIMGNIKEAGKAIGKVPVARKVKEAVKHPLTTTTTGLAAGTAGYGIPSILGKLPKEEERKKREEERKEKEEVRREKVEEYKNRLKKFAKVKKGEAGYEQAQKEAGQILREMKPKEVANLDDDTMSAPALVFHYNSEILRAVGREGIKFGTMDKIWSQIDSDSAHPAHQYVKTNPLIRAGRGTAGGAPPTQATPTTGSSPAPSSTPPTPPTLPPRPTGPTITERGPGELPPGVKFT